MSKLKNKLCIKLNLYFLYSYVRICFEKSLSLDPRNSVCVCCVHTKNKTRAVYARSFDPL